MESPLNGKMESALEQGTLLTESLRAHFLRAFRDFQSRWQSHSRPVLLAESSPVHYLAAFWVAVSEGRPVILGNPDWRRHDWIQLQSSFGPSLEMVGGPALDFTGGEADIPRSGEILIPTGGSGGSIKLARHRWKTLAAAARGLAEFLGEGPIHSHCVLPLCHVSGIMQSVRALMTGGSLELMDWRKWRASGFPPPRFQEPGYLSLVPTQLQAILRQGTQPESLLGGYEGIFLGGADWSDSVGREFCREKGLPILSCYGMTETAAMVTVQEIRDFQAGFHSVGRCLPHAQVEVETNTDETVGPIQIRAASLFRGYWGEPHRDPGDGFETGDLGIWQDGRLIIQGRRDQVLITGGEKVDPGEVAKVLESHRQVRSALVFGRDHSHWGQEVVALVETEPFQPDLEDALKRYLQEHLVAYKIPRRWWFIDQIPRTAAGKPDWSRIEAGLTSDDRFDL